MRLMAAAIVLAISCSTASAQLTLQDFNPAPVDTWWQSVLDADVTPAMMMELAVGNDDCELGLTDDQIFALSDVATTWGQSSRSPGQPVKAEYDLETMALYWQMKWGSSARVVRLQMCQPLVAKVALFR